MLTKYSNAFELAEFIPVPGLNKVVSVLGKASAEYAGEKMQNGINNKDILEAKNIVIKELKNLKKVYFDKSEIEAWMKQNRIATAEEINQEAEKYMIANTGNNGHKRGGKR